MGAVVDYSIPLKKNTECDLFIMQQNYYSCYKSDMFQSAAYDIGVGLMLYVDKILYCSFWE
jgi:hypothetical protein